MQKLLIILALITAALGQQEAGISYRFQARMQRPTDVAVLSDGRICVADGVNNRVVIFTRDGSWRNITVAGMQRPLGLAADRQGGLLITDTGVQAVFILDRHLKLNARLNLGAEVDPTDVYPVDDKLWVVNNDGHQLLIIDRKGHVLQRLGQKGITGNGFNYPSTVSGDAHQKLFICDVLNARIQMFDVSGKYLGQIGDMGVTPGSFYRPKGVAVRPNSAFVVSDSFTGVLHYFSSPASRGTVLRDPQGQYLRLKNPLGLCWDEQGLLWVVESGSGDLLGVRIK